MKYNQQQPSDYFSPKEAGGSQQDRGAERRSIERFPLGTSAVLQVGRSLDRSDRRMVHAVCQDISSGGAFFVTRERVSVGAEIGARLSLYFKAGAKSEPTGRRVVMEIDGTVIRKAQYGIAVKFGKKYSLKPAQPGSSTGLGLNKSTF